MKRCGMLPTVWGANFFLPPKMADYLARCIVPMWPQDMNSWVSCDVINFSGVNSKSKHRHGSELNVHCMCWPRVS